MTAGTSAAIFFDFDGVLVDSVRIKTMAFKELFAAHDAETVSRVLAHHKRNGGISRVEKIRFAHEHIIGAPLSEAELAQWAARYSGMVVDKVVAAAWIAGASEFLARLDKDLPVFVISGTPQDELKQILRRRDMAGCFAEILGSPTRKPGHIRRLLKTYRLEPRQCVFIGDSLTDHDAACETGLHFIGIQGEMDFPADVVVLPDCTALAEAIGRLRSDS